MLPDSRTFVESLHRSNAAVRSESVHRRTNAQRRRRNVRPARNCLWCLGSDSEMSRRAVAKFGLDDPVLGNLQPERDRLIGSQRAARRNGPLEVGWGHGAARMIE
jgi:hypothetical protein